MTNKKRDSLESAVGGRHGNPKGRFGTFGGVFTPCVLTILGVIMFMRAGYVTGYSGLWMGLVILGVAKLITTLTTLSISAIATNLDMKVGGVYFMISRVLGPDFGGSIGITLFFAQAVGVAFYTIGFTEAFFALLGIENVFIGRIVSTVMVTGIFILTFKGADVALKAQYVVLAILLLAVASFIVGGIMDFDQAVFETNLKPGFTDKVTFWAAFAIFFPAATGITAGANMSGDLKKPSRAIPWGTLLAILFTLAVYATQMVLTAGSSSREILQADGYQALQDMSIFFPLIIAGVFAATLSSALGSFLGAPRILQAMGQDRLMGVMVFFGKGSGENNEPRRATVLTFVIAVAVIWAGDLNAVAEVISMFFLIAYGMINLSAFVESKSANPSFRPRFKAFHWVTALAGAIGCGIAMFEINQTYAIVALGISGMIYFYLRKRDIHTNFGDAKRGYIFQKTRDNLFYLEQAKVHPKNWRPILVAITEISSRSAHMIRAGAWLESRRGLYTVAAFAQRPNEALSARMAFRDSQRAQLHQQLEADEITAFSEVVVVNEFFEGLATFMQSYSIGGLRPNTVIIEVPPPGNGEARERFLGTIDLLVAFNVNMVVFKPGELSIDKRRRTIDLWWRGEKNGSLMALFAYLMTLDKTWAGANLRILRIVESDEEERAARIHLNQLKTLTRISARIEIIRSNDSPTKIIVDKSAPVADLVLLGMSAAGGEETRRYFATMEPIYDRMPIMIFVQSNGEADVFA